MATKSNRSSGTQVNARGVTQGNTLVDPKSGLPVDVLVDGNGTRRLAVDANLTVDSVVVNTRELSYNTDSVEVGDPITNAHLRIESNGSINANIESDAQTGDSIAISAHPNQIFAEAAGALTTTAFTQIFTYTSTNDLTRIVKVESTAETPSTFVLKINGVIKRTLRSSPLERNVEFRFDEHRTLLNGDIMTVEAQVDRQIYPSYTTFTSIEGYLT